MSSPPPPPPLECGGDSFASSVQQFASIGFLFLFLATGIAAYLVLPKRGVNREVLDSFRLKVGVQVYWFAAALEAAIAGFLVGYVLHLFPCLWSKCHSESDDQSNLSALLLLILWPSTAVIILGLRVAGFEFFSLFHMDRAAKVSTAEPADVSAKLFQFNVGNTVVSKRGAAKSMAAAELALFVLLMVGSTAGSVSAVVWKYRRLTAAGYAPLKQMEEDSTAKFK